MICQAGSAFDLWGRLICSESFHLRGRLTYCGMCTKFYNAEIALLYTKCFDSYIIPCIMNDISKGAAGDLPAAPLLFRDIS